ncbi:MAG: signal recognition particle-docking protein FtsY [Planctomycetota bacterium]
MAIFRAAFDKLRQGLAKTSESTGGAIRHLLIGKPLSKELLRDLERALIQADVGVKTAIELRKDLQAMWERGEIETGDEAWPMLKSQLVAYFPDEDRTLNLAEPGSGPTVILVCGINGAGKTTSIAKLCKTLRDEGKSVLLGACDTYRAAAVEQLTVWATRLGVDIVRGQQGGDPAAVAFDACQAAVSRGTDVLILDTAGRLHTQGHLMDQLAKIRRVVEKQLPGAPHEVLLVIDATTGQNGVNQAKVFAQHTDVTGIFLSKLDGSARGGIVIAIREALNLPVKLVGVGETPEDVQPFEPEAFVEAMFAG